MPNTWLRFKYDDPIQLTDPISGTRTGESVLFLRAVRSDGVLYQAHMAIANELVRKPEAVRVVREQLRQFLERMIDEETPVAPAPLAEHLKGHPGWIEAVA